MGDDIAHLAKARQAQICLFGSVENLPVWQSLRMKYPNRIREHRLANGWSMERLAEEAGLSVGFVSRLERGERNLSQKNMEKFARPLNVAVNALIPGPNDVPAKGAQANRPRPKLVSGFDPDTPDHDGLPPPPAGIRELDLQAGLGGGGYAAQEVQDGDWSGNLTKEETWRFPRSFVREELRRSEDRLLVLETKGDSMVPTLNSGDRVIVDTEHRVPSPDGLYALSDQFGGMVVKRLQLMRRGDPPIVRVISDNEKHIPEDVHPDEIRIVGKVLFGLKRF